MIEKKDPTQDPTMGRVLIVDDEESARTALAKLLGADGYETEVAADGHQGLNRLEGFEPDVVLTDLKMPVLGGIELIRQGRERTPHTSFVVMTAFGTIESAVEAIKLGAESYLTKPLDIDAVSALVSRGVTRARLSREAARLRFEVTDRYAFDNILGDHPSMQRLLKQVAQVAPTRATVLIEGESGTGKELIAAALHHNSKRKDAAFVRLNCAALAESLLESELFGHERGAFTGAVGRRRGRFEQADGGTLFLDEVSEIPIGLQVKLLRFLQEREFERVGGNETLSVDVRVVAATNRNLRDAVSEGAFREDLFYRLNVVQLDVPPLRVRRSDIPVLAHHFLRKYAKENERDVEGFTDEAMRWLVGYGWPGNVRELENAVERSVVLAQGPTIDAPAFPRTNQESSSTDLGLMIPGLTLSELERMAIVQTLDAVDGSTAKAAELLGISQRKIQYRIKEWGIPTRRNGSEPPQG